MNKKFSTLVASLLLAGGLFSANAQEAAWFKEAVNNGYYVLKAHGSDATVPYTGSWSVACDEDGKLFIIGDNTDDESTLDVTAANAWKVTPYVVNGEVIGFNLVNANGQKLTYKSKDGKATYDTFKLSGSTAGGSNKMYAVGNDGKKIADSYLTQGEGTYVAGEGTYVALYPLPTVSTAGTTNEDGTTIADKLDVNAILGGGFEITIGKTKWVKNAGNLNWNGAYTLEGNVFTGKLTLTDDGKLKKANGKYIVLTKQTWGQLSNSLQTGELEGFIWKEATPAELTAGKIGNVIILASDFTITQPNAVVDAPLEVKATATDGKEYELMVATVAGTSYLTTGSADDDINGNSWQVGEASYTHNKANSNSDVTENTYVKFGSDNYVDMTKFNDAVLNITRTDEDGETLVAGPACGETEYFDGDDNLIATVKHLWMPAAQVATAYPEGQWLWNGSAFVNRESGVTLSLTGLREVEGQENVYTDLEYTYTITKVGEPGSTTLGYLNAENDDLLKEAFYIGTPVKATNDTVYIAKDSEGTLYLSADKAEAVEFRLAKKAYTNDSDYDKASSVDYALIQNRTKYASSKTTSGTATDVLNFYSYTLADAVTAETLTWDATNQTFVLSDNGNFEPIVIKNKAEGLYNLVYRLVTEDHTAKASDNKTYYYNEKVTSDAFCSAVKLYGAHNTAELKQADAAYAFVANDLFIIEKVDAGQHVSGIYGQNIKLFRDADPNYVLYEEGKLLETKDEVLEGFLGLQNIQDATYADMNPAMYVDSAAGLNTWRPEYMLALDVNVVPAGKYCEIHGANAGCKDEHLTDTEGYIEGRYLVNLVDSVKAGRKDCVYQNYNGADYYRLGFVAAKHIADSLVIASDNKVIELTGNAHSNMKICEFAFHYTDASRSAFTIETAYDNEYTVNPTTLKTEFKSTQGWIKYHNGVPVVTSQKSEAEVFNLAQTEEEATANETIAASAVTVIAGEGNVTIAGAAGKKVVIANILGQTIANTVLTSDNATIAAPAGVVVVAVEGEAAVKAIVK